MANQPSLGFDSKFFSKMIFDLIGCQLERVVTYRLRVRLVMKCLIYSQHFSNGLDIGMCHYYTRQPTATCGNLSGMSIDFTQIVGAQNLCSNIIKVTSYSMLPLFIHLGEFAFS